MERDEIARFARFVKENDGEHQTLRQINTVSGVVRHASARGYKFSEETLTAFLKENMLGSPADITKKIQGDKKVDFSEESIVRFSALRLQVDTDY